MVKQDNFDQSGSFVKDATIQECLFVASAFMETNNWCLGLHFCVIKTLFITS